MPRDIMPFPTLNDISDPNHIPSNPLVASRWPFITHNKDTKESAFQLSRLTQKVLRRRVNDNPGEGPLWDRVSHGWIEPYT